MINNNPVIILGMHRSGTSCLAGSLEEAGLYLGRVNVQAPHNAKGNRENRDIMDLNDAVLATVDASWDRPPTEPIIWTGDQIATRDTLINSYPFDCKWGFKEPRTTFTLNGWLDALPDAEIVATFRHPLSVAQSLNIRNGFSFDQGLKLWAAYNQRLLDINHAREIAFVCFDWSSQKYRNALIELSNRLGLKPPVNGFEFFENVLRPNVTRQEHKLPIEIANLYKKLKERAIVCAD
jgi:hypothetical protein